MSSGMPAPRANPSRLSTLTPPSARTAATQVTRDTRVRSRTSASIGVMTTYRAVTKPAVEAGV